MKFKLKLLFVCATILLLFSANVYSEPINVDTQGDLEDAISGTGDIDINLTSTITFDNFYDSTVSADSIAFSFDGETSYSFSGLTDTDPISLFRKTAALVLNFSGNVSINDFATVGPDNTQVSGYGGAIYIVNEVITISGSKVSFDGNTAVGGDASGGSYSYSSSSGYGGAIYSEVGTVFTNFTGSFTNNKAIGGDATNKSYSTYSGYGGAIYGGVTFSNSNVDFIGNESIGGNSNDMSSSSYSGYGGAIYGTDDIKFYDFTGDFKENKAIALNPYGSYYSGLGGAIYGPVIMEGFTGNFIDNQAIGNNSSYSGIGGAINSSQSESSILGFEGDFEGNIATGGSGTYSGIGGAISASILKISGFIGDFEANKATGGNIVGDNAASAYSGYGGAIAVNTLEISDFTGDFKNNQAIGGDASGNNSSTYFSGVGGAISTLGGLNNGMTITDFVGDFSGNEARGGEASGAGAVADVSGIGGAIYEFDLAITNFTGKFEGNQAIGGDASGTGATTSSSGRGGAIYVESELSLGHMDGEVVSGFTGIFKDNKAIGGEASGTDAMAHSSGRGGAIYAAGARYSKITITGGTFEGNSASTNNIGDMTSGLGGAIFFDVVRVYDGGDYSTQPIILNSTKEAPIKFAGNTHNPGGLGEKYNSIYFGNTYSNEWYPGYGWVYKLDFIVNVTEDAYLSMLDPMASQEELMQFDADEHPYVPFQVDIEKTGYGTWILGGYNDMQSRTTWTISKGSLQLTRDLGGDAAHLALKNENTSVFTLSEGAALLLELTEEGHVIEAKQIVLKGNLAPADTKEDVEINVGDTYTLLSLVSDNKDFADATIKKSGEVTVGEYDYIYQNGEWITDQSGSRYSITITGKKSSSIRVGEALIIAPLTLNARGMSFVSSDVDGIFSELMYKNSAYLDYKMDRVDVRLGANVRTGNVAKIAVLNTISTVTFEGFKMTVKAILFEAGIQLGLDIPFGIKVDVLASITDGQYNYERQATAGDYNSTATKLGLQVSKEIELTKKLSLTPYVNCVRLALEVSDLEEGNDVTNALHIKSRKDELYTANAGARIRYNVTDNSCIEVGAGYLGNFGDNIITESYYLSGTTKESFETEDKAADTNLFTFDFSGRIGVSENVFISLKYTFNTGENTKEHAGNLTVNYNW